MWQRGLSSSQNEEDEDGHCFLESHLFIDVHLCERYGHCSDFLSIFSPSFNAHGCENACVLRVCA